MKMKIELKKKLSWVRPDRWNIENCMGKWSSSGAGFDNGIGWGEGFGCFSRWGDGWGNDNIDGRGKSNGSGKGQYDEDIDASGSNGYPPGWECTSTGTGGTDLPEIFLVKIPMTIGTKNE